QLLQVNPTSDLGQVPNPRRQCPKPVPAAFKQAVHSVDLAALAISAANYGTIPVSVEAGSVRCSQHGSPATPIIERCHEPSTQLSSDDLVQRFAVITFVGRQPPHTHVAPCQLLHQSRRHRQFMNVGWGDDTSQDNAVSAGNGVPAITT